MMNRKTILQTCLSIWMISLLFASCRKVEYDYIDGKNPDEREREFIEDVRSRLLGAEHGWVCYMRIPANDKGFTFYMKFAEKNRVTMYTDFTEDGMTTPKESSFSLRNTGLPSLIFDTYNYIHMPADPNSSVSGGPSGAGQSSDFEYAVINLTNDTLTMQGNLKNSELIMVKLTAEQASKLHAGKLKESVEDFLDFFQRTQNNYISVGENKRLAVSLTHSTRQISYQILESDGQVSSSSATFFYTVDGIRISTGFAYGGTEFIGGIIKDGKLFLLDRSGTEHEVKQSTTPLTPLPASFGHNKTYKKIHIVGETLPAGVTSGWTDIYSRMVSRFNNASGRTILYTEFVLQNATKARLVIRYQSSTGSQFTADAEYDFEINGDVITLSNYVPSISNSNWNSRLAQIGPEVVDYFKNGSFRIDWAEGSGQEVLGGLYPVGAPGDFFYGILQ